MPFNWKAHFAGESFGADPNTIRLVQSRLNELGADPPLTTDGVDGPLTRAAVTAFQKSRGLVPDGIVGPLTLNALGLSSSYQSDAPASASSNKVPVPAFPGFARLSKSDQKAFVKAAQWIAPGEPEAPKWLSAVIDFESKKTWSPSVQNPTSKATGLIQFLPHAWGPVAATWPTTDELAAMSFSQQLEYVKRYFSEISRTQGKIHSLADMYLSVFSPKGVGGSPSMVLYSSGEPGYEQNQGLDWDGKGFITVEDVVRAPLSRLNSVASIPPILVSMGIGIAGIVAIVGIGAAWFFRKRLFGV